VFPGNSTALGCLSLIVDGSGASDNRETFLEHRVDDVKRVVVELDSCRFMLFLDAICCNKRHNAGFLSVG
jgi:hypothetical protein